MSLHAPLMRLYANLRAAEATQRGFNVTQMQLDGSGMQLEATRTRVNATRMGIDAAKMCPNATRMGLDIAADPDSHGTAAWPDDFPMTTSPARGGAVGSRGPAEGRLMLRFRRTVSTTLRQWP